MESVCSVDYPMSNDIIVFIGDPVIAGMLPVNSSTIIFEDDGNDRLTVLAPTSDGRSLCSALHRIL